MKCLAYTRADGGLSVVYPVPLEGESEDDALARAAAKSVPVGVEPKVIESDELPSRRFRGAWQHSEKTVAVDVAAARSIVLAEVRAKRNAKLAETDAEKSKLDDIGTSEQKAALAAHRKALRDLPATVTSEIAAMTAEQLEAYKAAWPMKS